MTCAAPPDTVTHGDILVKDKTFFYYEDIVEVFCHIGYVVDNRMLPNNITSKKITCQQDGTWDSDFPSCTGKADEDDDYWSCDLIIWCHPIISAISSGQSSVTCTDPYTKNLYNFLEYFI